MSAPPTIEITEVPVASIGGPDSMVEIGGQVHTVRAGQRIVLYARSGVWWIQPLMNEPFTRILPDSTWKNSTHLGTEYAALLVDPGYRPGSKLAALPSQGRGVVAVAVVKGKPGAVNSAKLIHFSGYDWAVRTAGSDHGGEANAYDPANAWTDDKGYLHLKMGLRNGRWTCAEVSLQHSLGYGTYHFTVADTGHLSPSAVLGIFTWDETRSEGLHNEFDIDLSRWADAQEKNAQYALQPFYLPDNLSRFDIPAGPLTHSFRWDAGRLDFKTVQGTTKVIHEHVFSSGVPAPAAETVHIDLYDYHHAENPAQPAGEVVIEKFAFSR